MTASAPLRAKPAKSGASQNAAALRRRAEQQLKAQHARNGAARFEADAQRLVHELQVHQVELQMQNAELQEARARTELLLEKYTDLYDFAPVGYFSLTTNSAIQLVNLTGARLLGIERARLRGHTFAEHVIADDRSAFRAFLKRVFADESGQKCEVSVSCPGQSRRMISIEATRGHDRQECRAVVMDITERRRAEKILSQNEAVFSALVEQAPFGVYVVDHQLRLRQVNPKALPVFRNIHPLIGRDLSEILGTLWPEKVALGVLEHFRRTLKTGRSYVSPAFSERRRDTGETEAYEWQLQRIMLPVGDHGVVCFFTNITERKRAEEALRRVESLTAANKSANLEIVRRRVVEASLRESEQVQRGLVVESRELHAQLRHLTREILMAQEEERKTISRELHDDVAQTLTGITVHLATLTKVAAIHPRDLRARIGKVQRLVGRSIDIVHRFARKLRPAMLDDLGLIPALRSHIRDMSGLKELRIRFTAEPAVEALDNSRRTVLYRVAQEALTNVTRHAQARLATVRIQRIADAVQLVVHDNGKSFPAEQLLASKNHKRLGLLGMRERVEMVGGTFTVKSAPGHGTTVRAVIPMRGNRRATNP